MMMKRIELTFKLNKGLKGKSPDGRNVKTKVTKEGDSLFLKLVLK